MSRQILVGGVAIGGGAPVSVQSMTSTDTRDVDATVAQIEALAGAGCDIVRLAVPDRASAEALAAIKKRTSLPLVADIHFDYRLALAALEAGIDKIRINPGNIGGPENTRAVAAACKARSVPIRVGVNGGSLSRIVLEKYGHTVEGLCHSALENVEALEAYGFEDIAVSLKASSVFETIRAYRMFAGMRNYPLHLGVTHAGSVKYGTLKSAAAFGALLENGIGDTLRVSLTTNDPVLEVEAARDILKALELNATGITVVSCPTCGRTQVDLIAIAAEVEARVRHMDAKLTVAVMGCAVNGPGESRQADIGIACGRGEGLIICKGEILYKVQEAELVPSLMKEIHRLTGVCP